MKKVNENSCHMCMPMGGIFSFKGVEKSMVILHGSQGCATYMRRHIAEHFNEPVDVASSSLNEKGTIYGGEKNLKQGLDNVIKIYNPKFIGVLTTCLAETIGEDVDRIVSAYLKEKGLVHLSAAAVSTPGYGGSHSEGYLKACHQIVAALAKKSPGHNKINVIVPNISPADIREIKRILNIMGVDFTLFPDYSNTLDQSFVKPYQKMPTGGTKISDIQSMSGAVATVQTVLTAGKQPTAGAYLEKEFGVPLYETPIPLGLENTDIFLNTVKRITGKEIPRSLGEERGRLLDAMIDSHKYNFQGRSILFGDPELVLAAVGVCLENGVFPVVVASGSKNTRLQQLLQPRFNQLNREACFLTGADFVSIREKAVEYKANIAIGSSEGKYLTEKEGIPLVRFGFPIHDRVGGQRLLSVGYNGTAMFLDRITNTLLENKLNNYRRKMYESFYRGENKELIGAELRWKE
ncbi:nitrogenase component 1 [Candidatus Contubernalis alkaliaceticus]|uniref:nitrogenase component 1 n=1 Tax=Candidatus Contubernalis alkaliaceticus TaxID=338645 RepID=UPI001F4C1B17|nr:nitrogenase component 1 [Candidatus Contubernalis alkalaceticus]UNC92662.1 nitrogenase [Candidatus Contubernalis alkalaceticus]